MKLNRTFILCGIVVFIISLLFIFIFFSFFNIQNFIVLIFFIIEAIIIYLTTTFFISKYHNYIINKIYEATENNGEYKYDNIFKENNELYTIIKKIESKRKEISLKTILDHGEIEDLIKKFKSINEILIQKNDIIKKIETQISSLKEYLSLNLKFIERIRKISMEIKSTSKNIFKKAQNVLNEAKQQSEMALKGVKIIGKDITSISEVKDSLTQSTSLIAELMDMSKRIKGFVIAIAKIAKKTNLLALNAGIEAARAGEYGKSFSIVAEEIKELSTNSNKSAEEITQILHEIQLRTSEVIEIIKTTERIEENIETFYNTSDTFIEIVKEVKSIEKLMNNITEYTDDHYTDSELLFKIISDISRKVEDYQKIIDSMAMHIITLHQIDDKINTDLKNILSIIKKRN